MFGGLGYLNKLGASGGLVFSPGQLFSGGEQGAWYDPSDNTTMFQESTGITPVTAVEQAVGLILDKSKGLVLGPELVTNGDFSGGSTGWTVGSGWSVGSGVATGSSASGSLVASSSPVVAGRTYLVAFDVVTYTSGTLFVRVGTGTAQTFNSTGRKTCILRSVDTVGVEFYGGLVSCSIDNISVRELAGNHAYQTTSASRPTLRARYNLLTFSEQFDNAAWSKIAAGVAVAPVVTANAGTAPDGTTTADRIQFDCGNAGSSANRSYITPLAGNPITLGVSYIASVYVKAFDAGNVGRQIRFTIDSFTGGVFTLTADWQRITLTGAATATTTSNFLIETRGTFTQQTADVLVWGAQFIQTAVFPSNVYQRIAAATDYATGAAFPQYLAFDGTDDSLLTASINFTGTDKMTVWSGLSKLSDAASSILLELSADTNAFAGSFVKAPSSNSSGNLGNQYGFLSRGSQSSFPGQIALSSGISAPTTNVWTAQGDISADLNTVRVNGVAGTNGTGEQGTGNFGNYPLYIGRRNNATLPFNGRIYSLIVRGAQSNSTQIAQTERYVASKTPLGVVP